MQALRAKERRGSWNERRVARSRERWGSGVSVERDERGGGWLPSPSSPCDRSFASRQALPKQRGTSPERRRQGVCRAEERPHSDQNEPAEAAARTPTQIRRLVTSASESCAAQRAAASPPPALARAQLSPPPARPPCRPDSRCAPLRPARRRRSPSSLDTALAQPPPDRTPARAARAASRSIGESAQGRP